MCVSASFSHSSSAAWIIRLATSWIARKSTCIHACMAVTRACHGAVSRAMACYSAAPSVRRSVASMGALHKVSRGCVTAT